MFSHVALALCGFKMKKKQAKKILTDVQSLILTTSFAQ